jgi:hypothetical protein
VNGRLFTENPTNRPDWSLLIRERPKLTESSRIEYVRSFEPTLTTDRNTDFRVAQSIDGVRIRINSDNNTVFPSASTPAPIEVQPVWRSVQFNRNAALGTPLDYSRHVDRISLAREQESSRRVSEDRRCRMVNGA